MLRNTIITQLQHIDSSIQLRTYTSVLLHPLLSLMHSTNTPNCHLEEILIPEPCWRVSYYIQGSWLTPSRCPPLSPERHQVQIKFIGDYRLSQNYKQYYYNLLLKHFFLLSSPSTIEDKTEKKLQGNWAVLQNTVWRSAIYSTQCFCIYCSSE